MPWKLHTHAGPLDPQAAYIGLSYALRPAADGSTSFVTCCSQVFDADGGGMHFIAYDVGEGNDLRNPYLSREQMRLIMARSLALYQDRHAGATPRQLVIHKQTPFTPGEVAGCFDAWGSHHRTRLRHARAAQLARRPARRSRQARIRRRPRHRPAPRRPYGPNLDRRQRPRRPPLPAAATSCRERKAHHGPC